MDRLFPFFLWGGGGEAVLLKSPFILRKAERRLTRFVELSTTLGNGNYRLFFENQETYVPRMLTSHLRHLILYLRHLTHLIISLLMSLLTNP